VLEEEFGVGSGIGLEGGKDVVMMGVMGGLGSLVGIPLTDPFDMTPFA
jgi:hypothetical protein